MDKKEKAATNLTEKLGGKTTRAKEPHRHNEHNEAFKTNLKTWDGEFEGILKQNKRSPVFGTTSSYLKRFNLTGAYSEAFVLNECYLRGRKALLKGKQIPNSTAWIRRTAFNVCSELSKAEKKKEAHSSIEVDLVAVPQAIISTEGKFGTEAQQKMGLAFTTLDPLDQEILNLYVVEGKRWAAVQEILINSGHKSLTVNTLSQRKKRALKTLEEAYNSAIG